MYLLNETVLLETKSTLFKLLIRETSQFLCYERLLNMTYVAYKNAFFRKMQFWSRCYTVVSYQALFRPSVYKFQPYTSRVQKMCVFARYATLELPRLYKRILPPSKTGDLAPNMGVQDCKSAVSERSDKELSYLKWEFLTHCLKGSF